MLAHIAKTVSDTVQKTTRARACERLKPSGTLALDKQTGAVRALGVVDERLLGACDDGGLRRVEHDVGGAGVASARARGRGDGDGDVEGWDARDERRRARRRGDARRAHGRRDDGTRKRRR